MSPPVLARRRALAAGLLALLAYLAAAAWSGHLSPLARRPLLDGLAPPVPYRWVAPPPELAGTNEPPTAGVFTIPLGERGSRPEVLTTDDAQATVILVAGTFPPARGVDSVRLTVTPLDPASLGAPREPLGIVGNAVEIRAVTLPGGDPVGAPEKPLEVILVYPLPPGIHVPTHSVISSPDGTTWAVSEGTDSPGIQQTEGPVPVLGYVAAAGEITSVSSPSPPTSGGSDTLGIALIVGAVCAALLGLGLLLRGREPSQRR